VIPGEWLLADEPVEINTGRRTARLSVRNTGDRPIQVGSHFHFFEVNRALDFDRGAALGMRLDIASGQSIRFEAGDERDVDLVEFGGLRRVIGFNGLLDGSLSSVWAVERAKELALELQFSGADGEYAGDEGTAQAGPQSIPKAAAS
jgi:urease subunit beta